MARFKRRSARRENKRIALERISILFKTAIETFDREPELAQRYVALARKIGMRYKVRIPVEFRRMICRHCKGFILPGKNCTVRIRQERETHLVFTCLNCGKHTRIPLKEKTATFRAEEVSKNRKETTTAKPAINTGKAAIS